MLKKLLPRWPKRPRLTHPHQLGRFLTPLLLAIGIATATIAPSLPFAHGESYAQQVLSETDNPQVRSLSLALPWFWFALRGVGYTAIAFLTITMAMQPDDTPDEEDDQLQLAEPWQTKLYRLDQEVPLSIARTLGYGGFRRWIALYEMDGMLAIRDHAKTRKGHYSVWQMFQAEFSTNAPLELPAIESEDNALLEQRSGNAYLLDRHKRTLYWGHLDTVHFCLKHPEALEFLSLMNSKKARNELQEFLAAHDHAVTVTLRVCLFLSILQLVILTLESLLPLYLPAPLPHSQQLHPQEKVGEFGRMRQASPRLYP